VLKTKKKNKNDIKQHKERNEEAQADKTTDKKGQSRIPNLIQ